VRIASGGVQYLSTGHLLYAQGGGLVAVPFDTDNAAVIGSPLPLREALEMSGEAAAQFAVPATGEGSLVYVPARTTLEARSLVIVDREGRATPVADTRAAYSQPRFSPDGQSLAVTVDAEGGSDVWVYDLRRGTRTRLTAGGGADSRRGRRPDSASVSMRHAPDRGTCTRAPRMAAHRPNR
jgi:hypothetical protein